MAKVKSHAFDLKESDLKGTHADIETYEDLARWLSTELDVGMQARGSVEAEIRYWWTLYEQGRTRTGNAPWPDAADLTSPMASEYVDAVHARLMQTVFTEPVWTVEGWGDSAKKAPFVEEFHQRAQEEERLQTALDAVLLRSLIEPAGILETSESVEQRREQVQKRVKWAMDPATQAPLLDEKQQPLPELSATGEYVDATPDDPLSMNVEYDEIQPVRTGPAYDVVPYLDFLTLPFHAKDRTQVWGYAKRFWRRVPEIVAMAEKGLYDTQAVEDLGTENEKDTSTDAPTGPGSIASQDGPTSQKELFTVQFLANLDGKGERWYRATVHRDKRILLRLNKDDRTTRYFKFVPFPRPGSTDGYSLIGHKLLTVIEEDTAVRNMRADKAALAVSAPVKKLQGALWDEYEQPFGPRAVITVRDMREVEPMQLQDVPASINVWKQDVRADADRLVGQNDTSLGQETGKDATLGEVRLRAGYAEVRMDLIVKRLKEPLEELGQARHNIYLRQLREQTQGRPMPQSMVIGLEARGVDISGITDGRITADMIEGQFWFKPKGSIESADLNAQMGYTNQLLMALANLSKVNPMIGMLLSSPQAAKSILEQLLRVYRWPDKQVFLGSEAQVMIQQQIEQQKMMADPQMQILMALGGGQPGAPGGMPGPQAGQAPPHPGAPGMLQ